jgi:hypothetical protein
MRTRDHQASISIVVPLALSGLLACALARPAHAQAVGDHDLSAARAEYARRFVRFDERPGTVISVQGGDGSVTGSMIPVTIGIPYLGVQHDPLDLTDFYEAVDRPDLAHSVHRRHRVRIAGLVGGLVAFGAGTYFMLEASYSGLSSLNSTYCDPTTRDYSMCVSGNQQAHDAAQRDATWYSIAGTGAIAVGVVGVLVYRFLDEDPEGALAHRRLAREHNRRLKRTLGLPADYEIAPYVQPGGGGLAVRGRF